MHALTCAEAQLHEKESERKEGETCIVSALDHAMRVAHASCEAALTRVDPLYDAAICDAAEYALCKAEVASALENAKIIVFALEYASTQSFLSVDLCGDAAMRAAIFCESIGAVALSVVLLTEFDAVVPPRGLFLLSQTIKSVQVVRVLLSSPVLVLHITDRDDSDNTVLMLAVLRGHVKTVTALLACPAVCKLVGAVEKHGFTVLMLASFHGFAIAVRALLACPAVFEFAGVVDANGDTALMLASERGHTEVVNALLTCPAVVAAVGVVDNNGYTALMIASYNANTLTVRALLACPAVVSTAGVVNNHGSTALMLAVMRRHVETVEALLCCPAVVATMGVANNGFTVLMIAEQTGHARMVQLLRACTVRS
jgi:serine/threonine-protein phosphatase 6 regulatory ankyrin repeat subunit B